MTSGPSRLADIRARLRPASDPTAEEPGLWWAAVALILVPEPDAFLLIRRADRVGDPWSGHLALPGGRRQSDDTDLLATAIRETREEVGVVLDHTDLAGVLPDVVPRIPVLPPVAVRPFVFTLARRPPTIASPEVAETAWIELASLAPDDAREYDTPLGPIWGMTERILSLLLQT